MQNQGNRRGKGVHREDFLWGHLDVILQLPSHRGLAITEDDRLTENDPLAAESSTHSITEFSADHLKSGAPRPIETPPQPAIRAAIMRFVPKRRVAPPYPHSRELKF